MTQQMTTYDWKRYWIKRGGNLNLDPRGYLVDPEDDTPYAGKSDLVTLEQLSDVQCLVLLSEPGMGKSTTVKEHYEAMRRLNASGRIVSHHGLQAYGTEERLIRNLFETTQFKQWREDSSILHLFLDSLDECMFRITNLAALLEQQVDDLPFDRLRLRLVCRTAVWPTILEKHLEHCFPNEQLKILELAPLRYRDVEAAAKHHDVGPQSFTDAVWEANATSLALKPVTLNVLLRMYKEKGGLPATHRQLYEQGCKNLCEEQNRSRWSPTFRGGLSVADKLEVASWLGFATMFAAKNIMRQDPLQEPPLAEEAPLDELSGLNATLPREHEIMDILDTGLFSSRGPSRLGWAHATYAEFLAARFVASRNLPLSQIRSLLFHHEHSETIIPQLRETASWLASMRHDVFEEIAKKEPTVLLTGDVASADEELRSLLVEQLLLAFDRGACIDEWYLREHYKKLTHPNLALQLAPYLVDRAKNLVARRAAIEIARECNLQELRDTVLKLAFDAKEEGLLRQRAVEALGTLGDENSNRQLKVLLKHDAAADPAGELLAQVLEVLYPNDLTPTEVFDSLAPLRSRDRSSFVVQFADSLSAQDLSAALTWSASTFEGRHEPTCFWPLHERILTLAWAHVERCESELARLVGRRLARHESAFPTNAERQERGARRLVTSAVLALENPPDAVVLGLEPAMLIAQDDFSWLLDEFEKAPDSPAASTVASLILWAAWREPNVELLSRAIDLADEHALLRETMAPLLDPVELGSARAATMRQEHDWKSRPTATKSVHRQRDIQRLVSRVLSCCERAFSSQSWWMLTKALQLPPRPYHPDLHDCAMSAYQGWVSAPEGVQQRILGLAKRHMLESDPGNADWFESDKYYSDAALGGYRALALLCEQAPGWVAQLSEAQLAPWVPVLVCFEGAPVTAVVVAVTNRCQAALLSILEEAFVYRSSARNEVKSVLRHCWTPAIAPSLLTMAAKTPHAELQDELFAAGLSKRESGFSALAWEVIPTLTDERQVERRNTLLDLVARYSLAESWPRLWSLMQDDPETTSKLWVGVAQVIHWQVDELLRNLEPDNIANLYIWLRARFPGQPRRYLADILSSPAVSQLSDSILRYLRQRPDASHLAAFGTIVDRFADDEILKFAYSALRREVARSTWVPSTIPTLAALVRNAQQRLVESEAQLLDVVCESLERFQRELYGPQPAFRDLWDKCGKSWRPVDENDLSDRLARHFRADLEERGIITNREVEIRRHRPGQKGERTDIYVDAIVKSDNTDIAQRISVLIEVKGSWHDELESALVSQLTDRYLRDNSCTHGLYLVGWFLGDGWHEEDSRKAKAKRNFGGDIEQARLRLAEQATGASGNGRTVKAFVLDARLKKSGN